MHNLIREGIIEKVVNGGFGLIRSEKGIVLVNYVVPGEKIKYRIKERAKGINWGELIEITEAYPGRVEPACKYYGECGGCVLSHLKYEDQIKIKKDILSDDLNRIGNLDVKCDKVYPSPEFYYRARAKLKGIENGRIGFIRKGTNDVMEITSCKIVAPEIDEFIAMWNSIEGMPFVHQLDLFFNITDKTLYVYISEKPEKVHLRLFNYFNNTVFSWKGNEKDAGYKMKIGEYTYSISPDTFFQINRFQWRNMLEIADSWLKQTGISIDLYTGSGFFIPILLKYSKKVIGIENNKRSVQLAEMSFKEAEFLKIPVEKYIFNKADTMIIDPPRSGIPKNVLRNIARIKPDSIIYISCSTATLARDLNYFVNNGYSIKEMNLIDLFPQTAHMETMTLLRST